MAKRESKKVTIGVGEEAYNDALSEYAMKDARIGVITSEMDAKINKIREKHKDELDRLTKEKDAAFEVVQTYCMENQADLFNKKRSLDTVFGIIGFRTGTPKLKLLKGSNWVKVLDNLKAYLPAYVRTIEEPAKDRLLTDRETPEVSTALNKVGLMVDQDERFFIELKKEETATA